MAISSSWKDRWVCIGGGTAGLGLILAQQFVRRGANVAIVGRDRSKAEAAAEGLKKMGEGEVMAFAVDLADEQAIARSEWKSWLERTSLKVAIAAAGQSDRGYLLQLALADIESLLRTNVYSSFNFSKSTSNALQRGSGTLVHIASLAGIVAAPGMGGYSMVKHAVVAMSRQLRLELASQGIRVLLVCPGPIRRELPSQGRYDSLVASRKLPESLKKPGGGANLKSLDAERFAERLIAAIESGRSELIVPSKAKWLAGLSAVWPSLLDRFCKPSPMSE